MSLEARWFLAQGVDPAAVAERVRAARARVRRYPAPVRLAYPLAAWFVRWIAPSLYLGRPALADRLEDGAFERLEERLARHHSPVLRAAFHLFRLPLIEQWLEEASPPRQVPHPLEEALAGAGGTGIAGEAAGPSRLADRPCPASVADRYDAIVIGSGAGGAPLACSLSRLGVRVAIVEAGDLVQPGTSADVIERHYLKQGLVVSLAGGLFPILAGKALGGSTAISSGTCLRPPREHLARWDEIAGTDFGTGSLDPWLDQAEELLGVAVPPRALLGPSARLFEDGLERLGRGGAYILPRCAPSCEGSGRCCFVCPTGAKRSTDRAFLPEAVRAGCAIFRRARATGIEPGRDDIRVRIVGPGGARVLACRELVIAAGALGTPGLIRRNRLGRHWRRAGEDLAVHPAVKIFAHFPEPVGGEQGIPQGLGYRPPELSRITFEGVFTPRAQAAKMMTLAGRRQRWWLDRYAHVASFGLFVRDRGRGRVRMLSDTPLVWYRLTPEDARDLGAGILIAAEAFLAAGADRVLLPAFGIQAELTSREGLSRLRPEDFRPDVVVAGAFHPHGTAGIGRVVDADLGLVDCPRVHVCDASVLPGSPGVNPMLTIVALSLRLADRLAGRLGLGPVVGGGRVRAPAGLPCESSRF